MSSDRVLRSAAKKARTAKQSEGAAQGTEATIVHLTSDGAGGVVAAAAPSGSAVPPPPAPFRLVPSSPSDTSRKPFLRVGGIPGLWYPGSPWAPNNKLLRRKQRRLESSRGAIETSLRAVCEGGRGRGRGRARQTASAAAASESAGIANALASTLIFGALEAGTAVVISRSGLVLTCAHCFGETEQEAKNSLRHRWALFYTGHAAALECLRWDPEKDLALARIVDLEFGGREIAGLRDPPANAAAAATPLSRDSFKDLRPAFRCIPLMSEVSSPTAAGQMPRVGSPIVCVGQPGSEDLESLNRRKTNYHLFEISQGAYRGLAEGQVPEDCSEIGSLMHDAWTYWGHSGAPLVDRRTGCLVGVHSSWDDQTAMRRGVPAIAIRQFLIENKDVEGVKELIE